MSAGACATENSEDPQARTTTTTRPAVPPLATAPPEELKGGSETLQPTFTAAAASAAEMWMQLGVQGEDVTGPPAAETVLSLRTDTRTAATTDGPCRAQ